MLYVGCYLVIGVVAYMAMGLMMLCLIPVCCGFELDSWLDCLSDYAYEVCAKLSRSRIFAGIIGFILLWPLCIVYSTVHTMAIAKDYIDSFIKD